MILLAIPSVSDRLLLALVALVLNALLGGPLRYYRALGVPSLARLLDAPIRMAEKKLNREHRSDAERKTRGVMLLTAAIGVAMLAGDYVGEYTAKTSYGPAVEIFLLALLLPLRSYFDEVLYVARALERQELEASRKAVREMAERNIGQLDTHAIARAAIEALAKNFTHRVCTPLLGYVIFGLPGLFVCIAVARLQALLGYPSHRYVAFGWSISKFYNALQYIPSRIGACLLAISAGFTPRGNAVNGVIYMVKHGRHFVSNYGWAIAAVAGGLGLTLGGPRSYQLAYIADPWVEAGTTQATASDVRRMLYLTSVAASLLILLVAAFLLLES